ncbi:uncharacterized protein LOC130663634 [Microplitis mediator]|uniref:uncharacterized protein LOC130663634 n=1 Tax=Microplitis mediator TaxID=375433 RepID=UPI0025544450|nr:uncharacterized protein LOC130663634 [Microplitis mediator]
MNNENCNLIGMQFNSYDEFEKFISEYQRRNKCVLSKIDSRFLLENSYKIKPNMKLKYKLIHLVCKHGEHYYKSQSRGLRNVKTYKLGCPMFIRVVVSEDRQFLIIKNANELHQYHEDSDEFFDLYPEQRRLDPDYCYVPACMADDVDFYFLNYRPET